MRFDSIPIWAIFAATFVVVMVAIEAGYRLGRAAHRRSEEVKESPVSAIAGAILGLAAFMLAFTFGIVWELRGARKELVRRRRLPSARPGNDRTFCRKAIAPGPPRCSGSTSICAWPSRRRPPRAVRRRALPGRDAAAARPPLEHGRRECAGRHELGRGRAVHRVPERGERDSCDESGPRDSRAASQRDMGRALWRHRSRHDGRGLSDRNRGIQTVHGAADLAVSFALVFALIASLDRPDSGVMSVSQRPLADLRDAMAAAAVRAPGERVLSPKP